MTIESGATMYLPHTQKYSHGYLSFHNPDFQKYFDDNYIQVPLKKGDAVFLNPAVIHAAGTNTTKDIQRMANLL
jgi:ectoine hydroxylase-related dioxygenase (phytanoyl-CoA dioxygenase family)